MNDRKRQIIRVEQWRLESLIEVAREMHEYIADVAPGAGDMQDASKHIDLAIARVQVRVDEQGE